MRIAFVTSLYMPDTGGAEILLDRLIRSFGDKGHLAVAIAPRRRRMRAALPYPVVRTMRPFSKRLVQHVLPPLLLAHLRHRFDLIHCHGEYCSACVVRMFKRITGVPYVVRALGGEFATVDENPYLRRYLRRALGDADGLIAQGQFLRQQILDNGGSEDRTVTIHNGVDIDELRIDGENPRTQPYLFYVGGLRHEKGYDVLVRAFAMIADVVAPIQLVMAGNRQQWDNFVELKKHLGIAPGRIEFVDKLDRRQVALHYRYAIAYVSPFRRSPFSNANLEAMAAGVPVIATDVGGNSEQIRHGREGLLVHPDNPVVLADALRRVCTDPVLRQHLAEQARKRSDEFSWNGMVDQYEAFYQSFVTP